VVSGELGGGPGSLTVAALCRFAYFASISASKDIFSWFVGWWLPGFPFSGEFKSWGGRAGELGGRGKDDRRGWGAPGEQ
jgi:hypothetical protein